MMVTKEDLKNLTADRMKALDLQRQIEDITEAGSIAVQRYNMSRNQSAYYNDRMADKIDKLSEYKNEYMEVQLQYAERNKAVLDAIRHLPNPYYEVIQKRYVEMMSWKRIAIKMNYSESAVRKIHDKAIKLLQ